MIADKYTIREQNEAIVLTSIINSSEISRSAVSQHTGLNKASISEIVKKLIEDNLVNEVGVGNGSISGGRKPILLQLNKKAGASLSIDLGYDYVSSMLTYLNGEIIEEKRSTDIFVTKENAVEIIQDLITSYTKLTTSFPYRIVGIGIAIHGIVFEDNILFTPYYNLNEIDLFNELEKITDIPIYLENEANLTAIAESTFSTTKNNLVSVSIHSGIGAGIVINDSLYCGIDGRSGEIGHMTLYPNGRKCPCGNKGCFEQYCSERSILTQFQILKGNPTLSIEDLVDSFKKKDELTLTLINTFIENLSIGLNTLFTAYGPEKIYINSALTRMLPEILPETKSRMVGAFNKNIPLYESTLGIKASLLGAAALVIKNFFKVEHLEFQLAKVPLESIM